jgi:hypothetical protein
MPLDENLGRWDGYYDPRARRPASYSRSIMRAGEPDNDRGFPRVTAEYGPRAGEMFLTRLLLCGLI